MSTETERTTTRPLHDLIPLIQQWGEDRRIIGNGTYEGQWLKLVSEIGELADNLAKGQSIEDDIGDCFVVICMMAGIKGFRINEDYIVLELAPEDLADQVSDVLDAAINLFVQMDEEHFAVYAGEVIARLEAMARITGTDFMHCVEVAYNEIKDRQGTLLENGVFVKEEAA